MNKVFLVHLTTAGKICAWGRPGCSGAFFSILHCLFYRQSQERLVEKAKIKEHFFYNKEKIPRHFSVRMMTELEGDEQFKCLPS